MKLNELMQQIKTKKLYPLYVFTGEEVAIMDIYMNQIAKVIDTPLKRVDSVGSIYGKLQNNSFINKPSCYVIRDDKDYLTQEKVWDNLVTGKVQGSHIIILIYSKLDARSKFYKKHIGTIDSDLPFGEPSCIVEFEKLSPDVLHKYIYKEINLEEREGKKLAEMCDCDYSRILLECDKIKHLANANNIDHKSAFNLAVKENLIYVSPKDVIFNLIDAVCMRRTSESFKLLDELNSFKDNTLGIISLLYTNFRAMLLVQSAGQCQSITERTGLTPWQVKLAKEKGNHYTQVELVKAIRLIRETEKGIKTGTIEQEMAVDYILVNVL